MQFALQPSFSATDTYLDAAHRPARRQAMLLIVAAHAAVAWGLLQIGLVPESLLEKLPLRVDIVAASDSAPPPPPPLPAPRMPEMPTAPWLPVPEVVVPQVPTVAAAPLPTPAPTVVAAPPAPPAPVVAVVATESAPGPALRSIPASAIAWLVPPPVEVPRMSRRLRESGTVVLRVYVDESGVPREMQLAESSGYARLDEAALAAMRKARFKPYVVQGQPAAGWALVPLSFEVQG